MAAYLGPIEQHRGPCLRLITLLKFNDETGEFLSRDYEVNNLAAVCFKRNNHFGRLKCSVKAKKLSTARNFSVELKISSAHLQCSELLQLHSENWTEWKYLGETDSSPKTDQSMYLIQVNMVATKVKASKLHESVYEDEEFIDFHLCAADGRVGVHKVFLAGRSAVFKRLLQGKWKETVEGCVEVEGLTQQTLQHLKDYLYLDTLPERGLRPLLLLAKYFLLDELKVKCMKKLVEAATADDLYALLEFACENNIPELTFDVLHSTPDETVNAAYKKKYNNSVEDQDADVAEQGCSQIFAKLDEFVLSELRLNS